MHTEIEEEHTVEQDANKLIKNVIMESQANNQHHPVTDSPSSPNDTSIFKP